MEERYHAVMESLNRLMKREEEKRDVNKIVTCVLIVLAVLVAVGGAAYLIYRLTGGCEPEDFEDEFEDDFDDEFFEDEEETAKENKEEKRKEAKSEE